MRATPGAMGFNGVELAGSEETHVKKKTVRGLGEKKGEIRILG